MRIAICDDDEQELSHLVELITEYQLSRGVSNDCRFFNNSIDFLSDMRGGEYDLVLLDVIMPGLSGVQVAQELRELDKNVRFIFISSSPKFAVESYKVGAYYYLLKPADAASLFPLLDRVVSELFMQKEQGFVLKDRKGVVMISFAGLEYVEVINKTVSFHMADGAIREVTASLADIEEKLLSRPEFMKAHRSYLVNLKYVQSIGVSSIVTKNGHSVPVSRRRRNEIQDAYVDFLHQEGTAVWAFDAQDTASDEKRGRSDGPWRILLVDDDPDDRTFWADILRSHGCIVGLAENGRDGMKMAADDSYDCILLDVLIPGEDGYSICEELRKMVAAPVIFLSNLTEPDRQVEGFASGGIEYITKDTPEELFWAKIETRLRLASSDRTQLYYGSLVLDLTERRALVNGEELSLAPIEFDILWKISQRAGHVFTPEEILRMVWGSRSWDGGQTVQVQMSRLRRKLEKAGGEHHFIETVWGQGYRFVPEDH